MATYGRIAFRPYIAVETRSKRWPTSCERVAGSSQGRRRQYPPPNNTTSFQTQRTVPAGARESACRVYAFQTCAFSGCITVRVSKQSEVTKAYICSFNFPVGTYFANPMVAQDTLPTLGEDLIPIFCPSS